MKLNDFYHNGFIYLIFEKSKHSHKTHLIGLGRNSKGISA